MEITPCPPRQLDREYVKQKQRILPVNITFQWCYQKQKTEQKSKKHSITKRRRKETRMIKKEKKKTYISPESPTTNTRTCPQRGLPFSSLCSQSRSFQNMFSSRPYKPYTPPKTNLIFKYRQTDLISKKNNSSAETPPSLI